MAAQRWVPWPPRRFFTILLIVQLEPFPSLGLMLPRTNSPKAGLMVLDVVRNYLNGKYSKAGRQYMMWRKWPTYPLAYKLSGRDGKMRRSSAWCMLLTKRWVREGLGPANRRRPRLEHHRCFIMLSIWEAIYGPQLCRLDYTLFSVLSSLIYL